MFSRPISYLVGAVLLMVASALAVLAIAEDRRNPRLWRHCMLVTVGGLVLAAIASLLRFAATQKPTVLSTAADVLQLIALPLGLIPVGLIWYGKRRQGGKTEPLGMD
jgi:formate hydrogenlyase subunit 3/multisubunit Na+/H+ antiporter MnhD subunit